MGEFSVWHWIVVAIVFLALFGYRKLPDAARSLGRSMRIFKAEMREMREDDPSPATPQPQATPQPEPTPHAAPVLPATAQPGSQAGASHGAGATMPGTEHDNAPRPRAE